MPFHFRSRLIPALAIGIVASTTYGSLASERGLSSHEHGVSKLQIAQEGSKLVMELEAPGDDLVGFEHEPKNDAQKKAVKDALAVLNDPAKLFAVSADAGCTVSDVDAEFETEGDHAGFHVKWSMTCENVGKAAAMNIGFFEAFPKAEEIEVEAIGGKGQTAKEVEPDKTALDLSDVIGG